MAPGRGDMAAPPSGGDMAAPPSGDMTTPPSGGDMGELLSRCGHPGDTGNSVGVGRFCRAAADCASNSKATICSAMLNGKTPSANDTYFCTTTCQQGDNSSCGEDATCLCMGPVCACLPNRCAQTDGGV